jgi:anaerobic ribonucleoside-triphosphate reductase
VGGANYQIPIEVRPERKIALALRWIITAARSQKGKPMHEKLAEELSDSVIEELIKSNKEIPTVEEIQDVVEKVLIKYGHAKTAKAYILYRAKRADLRKAEGKTEIDAEESAFLHMFAHKSKLSSKISYDRLESYKSLLLYLKDMQKSGNLPIHLDYLDKHISKKILFKGS